MTCCGQGRTSLTRVSAAAPPPPPAQRPALVPQVAPASAATPPQPAAYSSHGTVTLRYLERSRIIVRGPATGRYYEFSGIDAVKPVEARDAAALLRTQFFRQAR